MFFQKEQYTHLNLVAPYLSSFAAFMSKFGTELERGKIQLLFRTMRHPQKFGFEAVIAHAQEFEPAWEEAILGTKVIANTGIMSARYDFKSNFFPGPVSLERLRQYSSQADAYSAVLGLERRIMVGSGITPETYRVQGWIQGPVRNALTAYDYISNILGRGTGITGTLSYK